MTSSFVTILLASLSCACARKLQAVAPVSSFDLFACLEDIVETTIFPNSAVISLPEQACLNRIQNLTGPSFKDILDDLDNFVYYSLARMQGYVTVLAFKPGGWVQRIEYGEYSSIGVYIVIVPDEKCLSAQIEHLKSRQKLNPRARFLLALLRSSSQKIVTSVFSELWEDKIFNVALIQKGKAQNIEIYSWFPFKSSSQCTDVQAELIDEWSPNREKRLLKGSQIFQSKIPRNLHKCPLFASLIYWKYYAEFIDEYDNIAKVTRRTYTRGLELELFRIIAQALNMTPNFVYPDNCHDNWGYFDTRGKSCGVLGDVKDNRANVCFAGIQKNNDYYETYLESTWSYFESGFFWFVRCPRYNPQWEGIPKMVPPLTWVAVLSVNFSAAIFLCILGKRTRIFALDEWETLSRFPNCCQTVILVMLNSCTDKPPRSDLIRLFFLILLYYAFAFNLIFQTVLTQRLIDPGKESQVSNLEEIIKRNLEIKLIDGHQYIFQYSTEIEEEMLKRYTICKRGPGECAELTSRFGDVATIMDNKMFQEMEYVFLDEDNGPLICRLSDRIMPYRVSMYATKGLPLLERINDIIARVLAGGLLDYIWGQYVAEMRREVKFRPPADEVITYEVFNLEHVYVAFILVVFGLTVSVISLFFECCIYKCKQCKHKAKK